MRVIDRSDTRPRPRTRPLRIVVLGCGAIARQYHLPILAGDRRVALVGAADPDPAARAAAGAAHSFDPDPDHLTLLDREGPDAAVVCAASGAHAELAIAVAERRIHLYLEKPIATREHDGEALLAAARGSERIAQVGFNFRFHPRLRELRARLRSGEIGDPLRARASYVERRAGELPGWKGRRRDGGGVLLDLGSHELDLDRWLFGAEIAEVLTASVDSERSEHDRVALRVGLDTGVEVTHELGLGPEPFHRWVIEGSAGMLRFDHWPGRVAAGPVQSLGWRLSSRVRRTLPLPRREPSFRPALGAFVAASRGEPHEEVPSLEDGMASLRAVLAAERVAGAVA